MVRFSSSLSGLPTDEDELFEKMMRSDPGNPEFRAIVAEMADAPGDAPNIKYKRKLANSVLVSLDLYDATPVSPGKIVTIRPDVEPPRRNPGSVRRTVGSIIQLASEKYFQTFFSKGKPK